MGEDMKAKKIVEKHLIVRRSESNGKKILEALWAKAWITDCSIECGDFINANKIQQLDVSQAL